ncbi:hypothetical protein [Nibribacter koreensis]|uniref:Uncharacterized protein n=1 Tax=Nibribacter koreensis TaxID=1084519 RepID=A0ABP8FC78_9BACT
MRKSNLLLGVAVVFFLGCLTAFDFALKAEYETGKYKDRYRDYVTLNLNVFDQVEVNGATQVGYKILPGTPKVRLHQKDKEFFKVRQVGKKLIIDLAHKDNNDGYQGEILIYCPKLTSVASSSTYTLLGQKQELVWHLYQYNKVMVKGFKLDSLSLLPDHATAIELDSTSIKYLAVKAGATPGSNAKVTLYPNNQIHQAQFDMQHKSQLVLQNVQIPLASYQFSPQAEGTFTGASLQLLSKK